MLLSRRSYLCLLHVLLAFCAAVASLAHADESTFRMPEYPNAAPPPPRSQAEVAALLAGADSARRAPKEDKPLRIVLVAGEKDHGKGEHDYPAWQKVWAEHLPRVANTQVETAWEFPAAEQIDAADCLVFYQHGDWNDDRAGAIDPFLARGGGLVYIHWAVDGRDNHAALAQRIGLASLGGYIKFRHGDVTIDFTPGASHPIARNFKRVKWVDETYWKLAGDPKQIDLIGTSQEEGEPWPQFWTAERGRGRVFVSILGHYMWTFDDPAFRALLFRGIAWSARRDIDRFNDLVTLDARME
jgi:type 1 glutamine amidotransferase